MGCKGKKRKCQDKCKNRTKDELDQWKRFNFGDLKEKGRLQFFFHSPSSKLPIRDVCNEQGSGNKTEPHIEIGAENYINLCYHKNIISFLESKEKYLFLFTTCKCESLGQRYYDKRFIIGYIEKPQDPHKGFIYRKDHYAARGRTNLYSFEDACSLEKLLPSHRNPKGIRIKKLTCDETRQLLNHFEGKTKRFSECIKEIMRIDVENKTCLLTERRECNYQTECLIDVERRGRNH